MQHVIVACLGRRCQHARFRNLGAFVVHVLRVHGFIEYRAVTRFPGWRMPWVNPDGPHGVVPRWDVRARRRAEG